MNTVWSHFYVESKIVRLVQAKNGTVVAKGWEGAGRRNEEVMVKGYKVSGMQSK